MKNSSEEKKTRNDEEPANDDKAEDKDECSKNSEGETEEGDSSNTDCDQDSEVSFMKAPIKTLTQLKLKKIGSNT